ncbi:DNA polymerase III subunit gamma/tau [Pueribacillus theae]|uniref:DNA-directed DNA polymerase n=1 Tax=Pueribacillus theae TaxID=2171751 RepID=A0A2U1K4H8_9BACI|nr:DNA polymerase III subunit gamma/tau [Pueribacillus theae]PWA12094.1 DNA polymerase III subunit gamma/tau [Pueribacillus theae]
MSYQALYRVWRPRTFKDLIGQEHVTKTLQNAIVSGKFSHAYLFTGPRGTGKTTAAKIVAKAVNCEKAPVREPCNECSTCRSILDGSNSDVIEIDAASNNGVDEIRDLREKVKYAPAQSVNKVYIIDEVHMLSTGAFNALLKTLEEPPGHAIFILATTEPHKVPPTIISRCQRFDFRRIPNKAMVRRMQTIMEREGLDAENDALSLVARTAEGGMRDALSILDQVISYSDDKITVQDVLAVTGTVSESFLSRIASAFLNKDAEGALEAVDELIENGKDPMRFIEDLIYYFRDLLLFQTAPALEEIRERGEKDESFRNLAQHCPKQWIYSVIDTLNASQQEMKWTNSKRIFLEVAFVKLCQEDSSAEQSEMYTNLLGKIEQLESELNRLKQQQPVESGQIQEANKDKPAKQQASSSSGKQPFAPVKAMLKKASKQELNNLRQMWGNIMNEIRQEKVSAHAWLKDSQPVACSDDTFLLSFPYEMHCQMASKDQIRTTVEQSVRKILNKPLAMLTIIDSDWEKVKESFVQNQQEESEGKKNSKHEEDPLIAEAKRIFGEEIIEIKETGGISE